VTDSRQVRQNDKWRMLAKELYGRIPPSWRRLLYPMVFCYWAYQEIRPRFWIGESQGRDDGRVISVLCVAGNWDRSFLFRQVLGEHHRQRCTGRAWLWNLSKVLTVQGQRCCAVFVRARPGFRRFLGPQKWINIPAWVVGEVDLPLPRHVLASENVKKDLRRIRKNALTYEISHDMRQFDDFYHRMHVPYIAGAHGDSAIVDSYDQAKRAFKGNELLLVMAEGEPVAGGLIDYSETVPRLVMAGVRDGSRELVRAGVIGARYHFTLRHLASQGYTKAGLGKSRAFLQDGVLRYKKKLGMRLIRMAEGCFYLRVFDGTPAVGEFLRENPLIFERDGVLHGAVFVNGDVGQLSDADTAQLDKRFFVEGLSRLWVVSLGKSSRSLTVPPGVAERITVCAASEFFKWNSR